jgi:hypothetical protein
MAYMDKKREELLQDVASDWLWMFEDEVGRGLMGHHGHNGNAVVWKINDNGSCDYMDFYEFYRERFTAHVAQHGFEAWQNGEYVSFMDAVAG